MSEVAPAIVIVGVARGGTSLIAGICAHLGIPMGKGSPRYENPYLQWAVMHGRWDVVEQLIRAIEIDGEIWGWKLPLLVDHLDHVASLLPQARFLFVTKDVVSVARRRSEPRQAQRFAKMVRRTAQRYVDLARFAERTTHPTLFMSYEEVMRDMDGAIKAVAAYCGLPEPDAAPIIDALRRDHLHYREGEYRPRERGSFEFRLSTICNDNGIFGPPPRADQPAVAKAT